MSYIPKAVRQRVRTAARNRCGYCLSAQQYVYNIMPIDHIVPTSKGGSDDESNLWQACNLCNGYKGNQVDGVDPVTGLTVPLFNPRRQNWFEHFTWLENGVKVEGITPFGRATVIALQLNNVFAITVRKNWISVGWHPPID